MVLAEILAERRVRKARQETHAEWADWVQRRQDAAAKGIPFDEPHPQLDDKRNRRAGKA